MLNAGTATVTLKRGNGSEHLRSIADTSGVVNKIFAVHDTFDADIEPQTFCTQQISKHSEEGSRRIERQVHFNYQIAKSHMEESNLKAGTRRQADFDIASCVTDVVSGFFYAASLNLTPGSSQTFPVNDGGKTTDVKIEVEGRNRIKVPFGEFQALRVKAEPVSGPLQGKGVLWVWFTDDARHIPLQMKSKLGFATLFFQLQRLDLPKAHSLP
jgi:VCBS repeat-containing protein